MPYQATLGEIPLKLSKSPGRRTLKKLRRQLQFPYKVAPELGPYANWSEAAAAARTLAEKLVMCELSNAG